MKSKIVGILGGIILFNVNSFSQAITTNIENFFYQTGYKKGYKMGYKRGYIEGYKQAVKDFKTILKAYKDDIRALELGKYLTKKGYITYPRLWRVVKGDGTIEYKITGCRIEKTRNLEDIIRNPFVVPLVSQKRIKEVKEASNRLVSIPNTPLPQKGYTARVYIIPLSSDKITLLNNLGIPYEVDSEKNEVKAIFFSKEEAINFCKRYKCEK